MRLRRPAASPERWAADCPASGPKGVSVTGNAAQATAQNFELLGLEGVSVVYDDDADPATPNYKQSLDSLSLQGSLAAALGGGVLGVGTELDAGNEKLVLSDNAASASGGLAAVSPTSAARR